MNNEIVKQPKKIKKTDLSVTIILLIGIIATVNFIFAKIFYRFDLTDGRVYSVSSVTKKTVAGLDDVVNIKAYFSENLPSQLLGVKQEVADILGEYEAYSGGRVKIEFINPGTDEETQRDLYYKGIPQLTFEVREQDQMRLVNGYLGLEIKYGNKSEVIPAIKQDTSDLEYQITTAIKKATTEEIATIGVLKTQGTVDAAKAMQAVQEKLSELYSVVEVSLAEAEDSVPPEVDTLLIIGASEKFSDAGLKAVNSFIARGGALLLAQDGVKIGEGLAAAKNSTGLEGLLGKYGITLKSNLVADQRSGMASFSQGFITFTTSYPFWPKITREGFNPDNAAVAQLENVILPWASSVEVDEAKIPNGVQYLITTSDRSWEINDSFNIAPNAQIAPQGEQKKRNLAVFINSEIADPYAEAEARMNAKLIVVGDSEFPQDNFLQQAPDNLGLFQNLVDILSFDEDLIAIRSKGASLRPIEKELSDPARAAIRYANIFGMTALVLVFGLGRYYLRRRSKFVDEL